MDKELITAIQSFVLWLFGGAGGAYLLMKIWGEKWIDNKFSKDFETFKALQLNKLDLLLNRKIKWHEKEYEVLSETWKKLIHAHQNLKRAIIGYKEMPYLDILSPEELQNFLDTIDLTSEEKDFIKQAEDKNSAYSRALDWRNLKEALDAFSDFHTYFEQNRIFLAPEIKQHFLIVDDFIWKAWVSRKMSHDYRGKMGFSLEAFEQEKEKIKPLIDKIEDIIQKKLFADEEYQQQHSKI